MCCANVPWNKEQVLFHGRCTLCTSINITQALRCLDSLYETQYCLDSLVELSFSFLHLLFHLSHHGLVAVDHLVLQTQKQVPLSLQRAWVLSFHSYESRLILIWVWIHSYNSKHSIEDSKHPLKNYFNFGGFLVWHQRHCLDTS